MKVGTRIKTECGFLNNKYWVYGKIADITIDNDNEELFKIEWDDGGYDYLYDFEFEVA